MGPHTTQEQRAQLAYHVTVNRKGVITKLQPDFDYPKQDLGKPWRKGLVDFINFHGGIKHIIDRFDFDRLVIHVAGNSEPKEQKTMKLTNRQSVIVSLLRIRGVEGNTVATSTFQVHTGMPAGSVRRNIASLRNKGFFIESTPTGYTLLGELPDQTVTKQENGITVPEYHEDRDLGDENDFEDDSFDDDPLFEDDFESDLD